VGTKVQWVKTKNAGRFTKFLLVKLPNFFVGFAGNITGVSKKAVHLHLSIIENVKDETNTCNNG